MVDLSKRTSWRQLLAMVYDIFLVAPITYGKRICTCVNVWPYPIDLSARCARLVNANNLSDRNHHFLRHLLA